MDVRETRSRISMDLLGKEEVVRELAPLAYTYRFVRLTTADKASDLWVYMGPQRDYVVIPGTYCSCMDFTIRVISQGVSPYCKHLLALEVARTRGKYREVRVSETEAVKVIGEALSRGFSKTLREILYKYRA